MDTIFFTSRRSLRNGRENTLAVFQRKDGQYMVSMLFGLDTQTNSAYGGWVESDWLSSRQEVARWIRKNRFRIYPIKPIDLTLYYQKKRQKEMM